MSTGNDQPTIGFAVPAGLSALAVRYELVAEVGRGGMGVVYKARDRQTADVVALKVIHPTAASDASAVERFRNELLLARRITHKNVCRVFDLNVFDGTTVISMEFVEGRSLAAMLREVESMSTRQGLKIVRQIIAGLAEAHAQGVVHRDLKPENILLARDGVVKIMDFGIARLADSRVTTTGQIVGTPAYMSPEQAAGRAADSRSDIYSLGLVLYEMFCGRPAFTAETPIALVAKHVGEAPVAPRAIEADLPIRIDEAIRKCLEKDPDKRFQSVADLDAALAGDSMARFDAPRSFPPQLERARWQRSDWLLMGGAVVGLAAFFATFPRVSLAPRSQLTFDRAVLRRIAEEHLERLHAPTTAVREMTTAINAGPYIYLARTRGAAAARDAANDPVHYWTWSATFDGGSLDVDNRGRLVSFSRTAVPVDANARSVDAARRLAAQAIADFFGRSVDKLTPEREATGQVYGFAWVGPPTRSGLRLRYAADIDRLGVSSLSAAPELPPGYGMESFPFGEVTMNEWGVPVAVVIGLVVCAFGFVNRRRVAGSARWRTALVVVSFVAAAGFQFSSLRFFGIGDMIAVPAGIGVLFAGAVYFGSIALEVFVNRSGDGKLDTFTALFSRTATKTASGLALLRGCAIGLTLLGVDMLALWLATTYFGGWLSMIHIGLLGAILSGVSWPVALVVGTCVVQIVGVGLLVAFAATMAGRLSFGAWLGTCAAGTVLAASGIRLSMATVQPLPVTASVLLVEYGLLVAVFRRFDWLTLCAALGTFGFWWACYPLLVMQQPVGAAGARAAFVVWGLGVLAATAAAFWPALRSRYVRVASALD